MSTGDGHVIGMTKVVDHGDPALRWNLVILGDGYQTGQIAQFGTDVASFVSTLQSTPPFGGVWPGINVYRIDVASNDSGAADPVACGGTGAAPHTYFDASFCNGGIQRLLEVSDATVHTVVNANLPQAHMIMVLVNTPAYGGSGGNIATVSLAPSANEIALHEMGHTAFGFADEYEYYAGCGVDPPGTHDSYSGPEPGQPNISANANRTTNKWAGLIAGGTPMPTTANANCSQCDQQPDPLPAATVGAFEGAGYYHCALYRPQFDCRMRALGNPFCAVCQGAIVQVITPHLPVGRLEVIARGSD
jgi:IgA Peptidase M64